MASQNMPLRLSVNLSVQQLQHDSWLSVVEEALSSSGLAARTSTSRSPRA
jgi:EAL domain-containing protein (putative c-di-GMP-specific phosphodiesterase class I)